MSDPISPEPRPNDPAANSAGDGGSAPVGEIPAWFRKPGGSNTLSDEKLAAFIGDKWQKYQRKFAPFFEDPAFVPTWNWSAALFQSAWFLYRKLYLAAFGFMLGPGLVFRWLTGSNTQLTLTELQKPENEGLLLMQLGVGLSSIILSGGVANWLLFRRAKAAVQLAAMESMPESEALPWLARVGGINRVGVAFAAALFVMSVYASVRA